MWLEGDSILSFLLSGIVSSLRKVSYRKIFGKVTRKTIIKLANVLCNKIYQITFVSFKKDFGIIFNPADRANCCWQNSSFRPTLYCWSMNAF